MFMHHQFIKFQPREKLIILTVGIIVLISAIFYFSLRVSLQDTNGPGDTSEKIEFQIINILTNTTTNRFDITVKLENTGSTNVTIIALYLNNVFWMLYNDEINNVSVTHLIGKTMKPEETIEGTISLSNAQGSVWKFGVSVELIIQTLSDKRYRKVIVLQ